MYVDIVSSNRYTRDAWPVELVRGWCWFVCCVLLCVFEKNDKCDSSQPGFQKDMNILLYTWTCWVPSALYDTLESCNATECPLLTSWIGFEVTASDVKVTFIHTYQMYFKIFHLIPSSIMRPVSIKPECLLVHLIHSSVPGLVYPPLLPCKHRHIRVHLDYKWSIVVHTYLYLIGMILSLVFVTNVRYRFTSYIEFQTCIAHVQFCCCLVRLIYYTNTIV